MSNQYPNLPGVNMTVKDGQLLLTTDRSTNSMLIIAEAKTGKLVPEGPVYVSNEEQLKENFGGYFYRGELNPIAAQWAIARQNGVTNIYLLALKKGDKKAQFVDLHDKLFNLMSDLAIAHIVVDGLYVDEEIDGLTAGDFGVESLDEVDTVPTLYSYTPVGSLPVEPEDIEVTIEGLSFTVTIGQDEGDLVTELQAGANLENIDVHISKGVDTAFSADKLISFAGEGATTLGLDVAEPVFVAQGNAGVLLANYAARISAEIGNTIAYIAVKPAASTDMADVKVHVDGLLKRENSVSPYLQVVAGPQVGIVVPGNLRTQWVSGVTQYATLVSQLAPQNAPTNQILIGASALRYNLSPRQLNDLVGNKYVTFRMKNGQIRVVDGVTTAPDLAVGQDIVKSDFTRLSTLRIVNYMVTAIRDACDAFIGMPNEFANYNAMNTAIKSVIERAVSQGIIQDARYSVQLGQSLDESNIELTILPQFELRTINVTVGLSTPDNF